MKFDIPIALCIYNRPNLAEVVFQRIARCRPRQLLVYSDGPRTDHPNDPQLIERSRKIIERVDWDCDVKTNYSDVNLGCKHRMASGISWALEQSDRVIILEDDCVPAPSFFTFCQAMLDRYEDDDRIMAVTGNNFQSGPRTQYSYYFSKLPHCWGWATWRRAWSRFDLQMEAWPEIKAENLIEAMTDSRREADYWTDIFDREYAGEIDSWAYAWLYSCWIHNGLTVLPNVNLVSNIGFGDDATHTTIKDDDRANMQTGQMDMLRHPPFVFRHKEADQYTFDTVFQPPKQKRRRRFRMRNPLRALRRLSSDRRAA